MKYVVDNDLHIHSGLSRCSGDPEQSAQRILEYAKENGLKTICLTDHFWDESVPGASAWYEQQNFAHISQVKPLPQAEGIRFLFGCETEMDRYLTVGISREKLEQFDFIVVPTTHFHMKNFFTLSPEEKEDTSSSAKAWVKRLDALLEMELPFHKMGVAHLTCPLIAPTREEHLDVLRKIPDAELERVFRKAARLGIGIELNAQDMRFEESEADIVLRIYRAAKACGCKFYCASDAHHPKDFEPVKAILEKTVERLGLTEADKFLPGE